MGGKNEKSIRRREYQTTIKVSSFPYEWLRSQHVDTRYRRGLQLDSAAKTRNTLDLIKEIAQQQQQQH
jgi:hypothetical protein